jgi:hypothetical protein
MHAGARAFVLLVSLLALPCPAATPAAAKPVPRTAAIGTPLDTLGWPYVEQLIGLSTPSGSKSAAAATSALAAAGKSVYLVEAPSAAGLALLKGSGAEVLLLTQWSFFTANTPGSPAVLSGFSDALWEYVRGVEWLGTPGQQTSRVRLHTSAGVATAYAGSTNLYGSSAEVCEGDSLALASGTCARRSVLAVYVVSPKDAGTLGHEAAALGRGMGIDESLVQTRLVPPGTAIVAPAATIETSSPPGAASTAQGVEYIGGAPSSSPDRSGNRTRDDGYSTPKSYARQADARRAIGAGRGMSTAGLALHVVGTALTFASIGTAAGGNIGGTTGLNIGGSVLSLVGPILSSSGATKAQRAAESLGGSATHGNWSLFGAGLALALAARVIGFIPVGKATVYSNTSSDGYYTVHEEITISVPALILAGLSDIVFIANGARSLTNIRREEESLRSTGVHVRVLPTITTKGGAGLALRMAW